MGVILLVRHGQASFGTDDYDRLSELGTRQSASLGSAWEAGGAVFTDAIAGGMLRHAQTAIAAIDASGLGEEDADPGLPQCAGELCTALTEFAERACALAVHDGEAITVERRHAGCPVGHGGVRVVHVVAQLWIGDHADARHRGAIRIAPSSLMVSPLR